MGQIVASASGRKDFLSFGPCHLKDSVPELVRQIKYVGNNILIFRTMGVTLKRVKLTAADALEETLPPFGLCRGSI